jgi:hypothetical protein
MGLFIFMCGLVSFKWLPETKDFVNTLAEENNVQMTALLDDDEIEAKAEHDDDDDEDDDDAEQDMDAIVKSELTPQSIEQLDNDIESNNTTTPLADWTTKQRSNFDLFFLFCQVACVLK